MIGTSLRGDTAALWRLHRRDARAIRRCTDLQHPPPNSRPRRAARPRASISYTSDRRAVDVAELADLACLCATFAPGTALDALEPNGAHPAPDPRLRRRLATALRNSLECVAAFAPQSTLPAHRHLHARGLGPLPPAGGGGGWQRLLPRQQQLVLVGFARAVGDGALVATVHDVAVMPEVRGKGVGKMLMQRLMRQLYDRDIIDVGVLAPTDTEGFFEECGFGDDSEGSVVMLLSPGTFTAAPAESKDTASVA